MVTQKDQQIIDAIKNGNEKALEDVYKAYRGEFISWCYKKYEVDNEQAKEIYQETILIFYQNLLNNSLQTLSSSIKTYLFAIGVNKVREKFREKVIPLSDTAKDLIFNNLTEPDLNDEQEERIKTVEQCMSQLGDSCQKLLYHFYFLKLNMDSIAEKLGYKNATTAKNLKYKCIQRLQQLVFQQIKIS